MEMRSGVSAAPFAGKYSDAPASFVMQEAGASAEIMQRAGPTDHLPLYASMPFLSISIERRMSVSFMT